jgi:large subunit ribosomal protein L23
MNEERLTQVLIGPHVSEKTTRIGDLSNQVVFRVLKDARKAEVKRAVERMFEVEVDHVRTVNVKGKRRGFRGRTGRTSNWKKAYVRLKPGHEIELLGSE